MSSQPQPFTYQHFNQAIHSLTDGMLMYYIDEAVGIYCRLRGITVGPRPASAKDYSPEYADAFEAANFAVYTVASRMAAFNPAKGPFRPYLHKALENALKDILKADGFGDFFDQTSKKKNKEDEPEKHYRVDVDTFRGTAVSDSEPDTVLTDRAERIRQHEDDALETMISYIDGLTDMKRAAIYASAFGQILRPDLAGYGRNYADILAATYHTTASYIRKLASEGRQEALDQARRMGFGPRSMGTVSMEMIQVKKAPDVYEMVIQATSELTPYQQFKLLRHLASKVEEVQQ